MPGSNQPGDTTPVSLEIALRHLGTRWHGQLEELFEDAIRHPDEDSNVPVLPLLRAQALPAHGSPQDRAEALAMLVEECIGQCIRGKDRARLRAVLHAAYRLPLPEVTGLEAWSGSLNRRHEQLLRYAPHVFGSPSTVQPMQRAWKDGVRRLAKAVHDRLVVVAESEALPLAPDDRAGRSASVGAADDLAALRPASRLAQPVFMDLYIATVIMRGRRVARRINDRLLTAQVDRVEYFKAQVYVTEEDGRRTYVPTRALFGCSATDLTVPGTTQKMTLLNFPRPLLQGEQVYFTSEVEFGAETGNVGERDWINVDVDHFGIARGRFDESGLRPVRGLTIRVHFDEEELPERVWWYAEADEKERETPPEPGDRHLLRLEGCDVQHTFTESVGQPRENYGIGFMWPHTGP